MPSIDVCTPQFTFRLPQLIGMLLEEFPSKHKGADSITMYAAFGKGNRAYQGL
jgi:hypothetical protein